MFLVDKLVHNISLINVQPEENCRIEFCKVFECQKKSAWTDLDRVSFKKIFKESNVEIEKSAWTGLGKVKKGFFSGKCL